MIVVRAPLRVSLIGGGSDYPSYFRHSAGAVLGGSIGYYVYVTALPMPPFARERYRLTYRVTESVNEIDQIHHPLVRAALRDRNWQTGLSIATFSDLPGGTGLGSSSAFAVALSLALDRMNGQDPSPLDLAQTAVRLEREILAEPGGLQDQFHAAYGGFRLYEFSSEGTSVSEPLLSGKQVEWLEEMLVLVYTGISRSGGAPASATSTFVEEGRGMEQAQWLANRARMMARQLSEARSFEEMYAHVRDALRDSWLAKAKFGSLVVGSATKVVVEQAIAAGASAGKLCGAGGAGFVLLQVPPSLRHDVLSRFPEGSSLPTLFTERGADTLVHTGNHGSS